MVYEKLPLFDPTFIIMFMVIVFALLLLGNFILFRYQRKLQTPEPEERAKYIKRLYHALISEGFTKEEALEIIKGKGS